MSDNIAELRAMIENFIEYTKQLEREVAFLRAGLTAVLKSDEELEKARKAAREQGLI